LQGSKNTGVVVNNILTYL